VVSKENGMAYAPEQLAESLRIEGGLLLERAGLAAVLHGYGQVYLTGSYALDLMAWRTMDIHLVLYEMWDPLDAFFALGHQIAKQRGVIHMAFGNFLRKPAPGHPGGLYWGVRLLNPENGEEWMLDIWAVDETHIQQNNALMQRIRDALDGPSRRLILDMKHALLTPEGRTPPRSGIPLCEAVLFEGLRNGTAIRAYLRQHGVEGV
jgi:hypothetical protein